MISARLMMVLLAFCFACGASSAGPAPPSEGPVELVSAGGDAQVGLTLAPLPDSMVVKVMDKSGTPVAGATVRWEARGSDDLVLPAATSTDRDGTARAIRVLGPAPGVDTVRARIGARELAFTAEARTARPGQRYEGRAGYVSYEPGGLPLIVSAGHGGLQDPDAIPDRTEGTLVADANTDQLAMAMADSLEARFGARPHLIISHLRRRKLDVNRELGEAAQGNPLAEHAWREYHGFIDHARARVEAEHGPGLYIDVHGHGHEIRRLELGYLLSGPDLNRSDEELDAGFGHRSSIRALAEASSVPFSELIRGNTSLGALYEETGVPAVPSAQQPAPGADPFFSGGYSTRRHGSRDGGAVSGVQIEAQRPGVRDTEANRAVFAGISSRVLEEYLALHFDFMPAAAGH